jgi:drug/metabolite transporter (DMT)-like permease
MSVTSTALAAPRAGRWALLVLVLGALMLSFSGVLVKLSEVGPSATAFYRMTLSLPLLLLLMTGERRAAAAPARRIERRDWRLIAGAGMFLAGDLVSWHWALHITSVANATLLGNCAAIFVALASWLLFRERFASTFLLGLVLAVAGSATLVGGDASFSFNAILGDLLGVVTGAFYAGYINLLTLLRARLSTATVLTWTGLATVPWVLAAALLGGERLLPVSLDGWLFLIALAVLCQFVAMSIITLAMAHLPASLSSIGLLIAPVGATINAWWILGEPLGPGPGDRRGAGPGGHPVRPPRRAARRRQPRGGGVTARRASGSRRWPGRPRAAAR